MTDRARTVAESRSALAVLGLVVALGVSGCSRESTPDKADLARLLNSYLTSHCDVETVTLRASRLGTDAVLADEATFATKIVADPDFQSYPGLSSSYGKSGSLSFKENGEMLHAEWNELAPPEANDRDRLTIASCLYVPSKIEITDQSLDDKSGSESVVFRGTYRLSLIGQSLLSLGMLTGPGQLSAEPGFQFVARLRSDSAGDWRVNSVRVI